MAQRNPGLMEWLKPTRFAHRELVSETVMNEVCGFMWYVCEVYL